MTIAQQIVAYKKANPSAKAKDIAKKFKTKVQYVYTCLYLSRKQTSKKQPTVPNAAPKVAPNDAVQNSIVSFLRKQNDELRKEIGELTVVIAYLEHRCARAEAKNGVAV